ncbi:Methyltransferase domain-containing protein [Actinacidiphila yanglinensis]|uniref:Methyltransferase domain-containing protein n=1 Tax=Actinacidiphila yanglinensis TaxID=310779 RepID=A0A1H6DI05_9ACTN|nr:class I SAM-dependent methyltransferase [Actinacidiphila yanglinensis]SEG84463.1 Methyltransferase domain-containing protein [Actinacidiphila yanglinensis]
MSAGAPGTQDRANTSGAQRQQAADVARIFNSAVAAWSIAAAWEIGALDELREKGRLDAPEFAERHDLDVPSTEAVFTALATVDIVRYERSGGNDNDAGGDGMCEVLPGPAFEETYRTKALFHWLCRGSAPLFTAMPDVMRNANRTGRFYRRDAEAISRACADIDAQFFQPAFRGAMDALDFDFSLVVDLGCGGGGRLTQILRRHPQARGLGIDIAPAALDLARGDAADAGVGDRVSFVHGDVRDLAPRPEFEDAELLTCFMMGHDFWPRADCVASLRRLRDVFPRARRFLLGDTARTQGPGRGAMPVFSLGYEVGHALMGACIPSLDEWRDVFPEAGWELRRTHLLDTPAESFVFELG